MAVYFDSDDDNDVIKEANEQLRLEMEEWELQKPVTEQDIKILLDVIKKEAPCDETAIKQLWYGMNSGLTKYPIPHIVNSRMPGAGKSYDLTLVAKYLPSKHLISISGISDKAIFHQNGVSVIENEITGETEEADPILEGLETELDEIQDDIEKAAEMNDKSKKKELRRRFKEVKREFDETRQKVQKLIILDGKILLVLDTARDSFYNALMSLVSQDTIEDQKYLFVEQTNGRKFSQQTNRLRGTPVIFTTQVIDDTKQQRFREKNRRFVNINPDTSAKKIQAAKRLIGLKGGLLPEEYDDQVVSREDQIKAKHIGERIAHKLTSHSKYFEAKETGVKIPFIESIAYGLPGDPNDVWGMTVMDRAVRYLAIITKVNMDCRPRLIDLETEGKFYPIAIFEDLYEVLQILSKASSALRPYIVNWYNKVFITGYKEVKETEGVKRIATVGGKTVESENNVGLSTKYLADRTQGIMGGLKPSREEIRESYLEPLCNLGIVDKFQSELNKNENLYCPVDDVGSSNIFSMYNDDENNSEDFRLKIRDSILYPCKNLMMESIRTVVKRNAEGHTSTTKKIFFQKYKLVDPNGVEITTEECIDRYLSNPNKCFKRDYDTKEEENQKEQKLVRPILNKVWMYRSLRSILQQSPNNVTEESSMAKELKPNLKPLEEWKPEDYPLHGCIYCMNNGGYHGPTPLTAEDYETHIVKKHPGKPAYPGPADIEKYCLEPLEPA